MNKKLLVFVVIMFFITTNTLVYAQEFTDVSGHWAGKQISQMYFKGIIDGFPDGSFRPDELVTRAQLIKMVICAMGLKEDARLLKDVKSPFKDIKKTHWANGYINLAWEMGLVKGDQQGNFKPGEIIDRLEITVVLARAVSNLDETTTSQGSVSFRDMDKIPTWAKRYVKLAVNQDIIRGFPDNTFKPFEPAKRSESVVMIQRMLKQLGTLYDVNGFFEGIDTQQNKIYLNVNDTSIVISLGNFTKLYKSDQLLDFEELKPGDEVYVILNRTQNYTAGVLEIVENRFDGVIEEIDYNGYQITVKPVDKNNSKTLHIRPEGEIYINGKKAALEDLLIGDSVSITLNSFMGGIRLLEVNRNEIQ